MKKTFAVIAMLSIMLMFVGQIAKAQTLTAKKYASDVTFTIDGDLSDWPADAKVIDQYTIADVGDHSAGPVEADITFDVYLAWDDTYLYIAYDCADPTGLDETEVIASRYLDDMFRLYLETDTDGTINDGPDNDEFGIDLRASTTGPLNEVTVISWHSGNFVDPSPDTNLNGDAAGTMVVTTAANDDTAYIWEARVAWSDILAHGAANSTNLSKPQDGDVWTWDMLLIDDGPVDGQQFNLTSLHAPTGWANINFVDVANAAPAVPLVHDGLYAAKLTRITGGGDSGFDIDNAKIDVTGLSSVQVSWWMRSGNGEDTPMNSFVVAPFNSSGAFVGGTYGQPNLIDGDNVVGGAWEYRTYEYVIPDPEVTQIMLGIRMDPGNSVVLDDVVVEDTANPGVNMKTNGSFEAWGGGALVGAAEDAVADDGAPDDWRFFAVAGAQGSLERLGSAIPTNVQEGMYSAKVTRLEGSGGDSAFDKDVAPPNGRIDITGITELKYSFWMRSGTGADLPAGVIGGQIQPFTDAGAYQPPSVDVVGPLLANGVPATWKYFETIYTPDDGVVFVSVRYNATAGNSFVVDDIKLIDTATGTDVMSNGGLEAWGGGSVVGTPEAPDGVPDSWRCFAVGGSAGRIERLQFQPPAPNAVQIDWTTMQ